MERQKALAVMDINKGDLRHVRTESNAAIITRRQYSDIARVRAFADSTQQADNVETN